MSLVVETLIVVSVGIIVTLVMSLLLNYKTWKVCVYGSVVVAIIANAVTHYLDLRSPYFGDWGANGLLAELFDPDRWLFSSFFVLFFVVLFLVSKWEEGKR